MRYIQKTLGLEDIYVSHSQAKNGAGELQRSFSRIFEAAIIGALELCTLYNRFRARVLTCAGMSCRSAKRRGEAPQPILSGHTHLFLQGQEEV